MGSCKTGFKLLNRFFKGKLVDFSLVTGNQYFFGSLNLAIEVIGRNKDNTPVLLMAHYVIEGDKLIPCPVVEVGVNIEINSISVVDYRNGYIHINIRELGGEFARTERYLNKIVIKWLLDLLSSLE